MKDYCRVLFAFFILIQINYAQERVPPPPCYANGNTGAGGVIGPGLFLKSDTQDNIQFHFGAQQEQVQFDGVFVIYIATGAPGRSVLDNTVDDDADVYRIAITNSNINGFGSTITFPTGFEASYAIAIDTNSGGLYSIPSSGNIGAGGLTFITSVNSTLSSSTQPNFEIDFSFSDIGITSEDTFYLVGIYVDSNGFTYDEGYGDGIQAGTQGNDNITFTGARAISSAAGCQSVLGIYEEAVENIRAVIVNNGLMIQDINEAVTINIFDITGKLVLTKNYYVHDDTFIPLDALKPQLYFIVIETSNSRAILKALLK